MMLGTEVHQTRESCFSCWKLRGVDQETHCENALCGTAIIKSLTKAVIHCSLYTFRRQGLEMETKHLGDNLKACK